MIKRFFLLLLVFSLLVTLFVPCVAFADDGVSIVAQRMRFNNASIYADILRVCNADLQGFSDYLTLAKTLSPPSGWNDSFYYPELNLVIYGKSLTEGCVTNYNDSYPETPISVPYVYGSYGDYSYQQAYLIPCVDAIPKESDSPGERTYLVYNIETYFPVSSDSDSLASIADNCNLMGIFTDILSILPSLVFALIGFIAFRKALTWFGGILKGM